MSSANPYAAPQTLDRPVREKRLPVAHFAAAEGMRQMYPEYSTEALGVLMRRRKALDDVRVVWLIVTLLLGVLGGYWIITETLQGALVINAIFYNCLPVIGAAFAFIRWNAGIGKHQSDRYLALCFDGLLFAGSWGIVVSLIVDYAHDMHVPTHLMTIMLAMPFLMYSGYYAFRSLQVLNEAQLLFGPERLEPATLKTELAYRQTHGIE